ncbi:methylated-DNA--[protein]-cysteine S-methyltransferase [Caulobacter sp. S45]|uniref:methylated-DNA--[protein]-cysteine S-methyltransferase n=1 Tax=Caulobacter sp. S45 TaxID=1641861 RepID=UPI00131E6B43|nr:methylated-DNA--[protein]-cysteine S-methyltransferase [Caulobacter sp. S45]
MDTTHSHPTAESFLVGFGETGLGSVLVASSAKGVSAILLGDDQARLRRELAQAFPGISLVEDAGRTAETVAKVVAFIDAPHLGLDLPLDLRGSDLELAVWAALRAIPSGETRTYGGLAKALDMPATAQEVGAACAANVVAVAVPCHRVVKADGSISGYRWGVPRKRRLINMEGVA